MTFAELDFKQFCDLRSEFVNFKIQDNTTEELIKLLKKLMYKESEQWGQQELKDKIDEYDEYLYDILVSYVKDEENASEVLEEFKQERLIDWIDS
tara:strand:+ start:1173 stop:1457 length:285 start_codon:yes stop_codon:yes gene_type:complete